MKKLLALILSLAFCAGFAACAKPDGGLSVGGGNSDSLLPSTSDSSSEQQTTFYDIRYVAVIDGTVSQQSIPVGCFQESKSYPTRYEYGKGATIDELQSWEEYEFCGWYVDEACTNAFSVLNNTIGESSFGEVKLYAKFITQGTITYRAIISGEEKEIVDGLWQDGGAYPTTYQYGQSKTVSALKSEYTIKPAPKLTQKYDFEGWYADAACTQPFNGQISAKQRGNVIVYAKLTYEVWAGPY